MMSYEFYVNSYLGSAIPEKAFDALAAQAAGALERLERKYQVEGTQIERAMAVCAMAESLHKHSKRRGGIAAETVGSMSVRYETGQSTDKALARELYQKASIYLRIYRGVAG